MNPEDFQEIISRMSENSHKSLERAEFFSRKFKTGYIGIEHILLGILANRESSAATLAYEYGLKFEDLYDFFVENPPISKSMPDFADPNVRALTDRAVFALKMASLISGDDNEIGTKNLLFSILKQKDLKLQVVLRQTGADIEGLVNAFDILFSNENLADGIDEIEQKSFRKNSERQQSSREIAVLKKFGEDLTEKAKNGELDPAIGRETEVQRLITVLLRRTKSNPVLIGEAGVGKTAVVELLAQKISKEQVPSQLIGKRIFEIDLAGMLAGTKFRGQFEERLKNVIKALEKHQEIIAFIDEIHLLAGTGSAEGAMDAANILKPALARGEFQVIGATTLDEYKKHIEKDAALERRFQPVQVGEPNEEDALEILKGLRDRYEAFHKAKITDEALKAAVSLSSRYITDRFLPDKAIDVVDEAASKVRMEVFSAAPDVKALEERLKVVKNEKEAAVTAQDFEKAAKLRDEEKNLVKDIDDKKSVAKEESDQKLVVTEDDIAAVVAQWTGIPVAKIAEEESETLLHLEEELHKRVVGQDDAVTAVAKAVRRARAGLKDPKRPIGSFLFLGPTGVGKTELARALASSLFGDESAMIRLDMSEYMEKHTVSRLVGAPPGYVGYEEGGQLTDAVRRKPYSVILLDEVEKAHADFFNILLQVLDDGRLTDSQGRTVDFRNTVIIMTSNLGAKALHKNSPELGFLAPKKSESSANQSNSIDFKEAKKSVMDAVKRHFRPEFLNRIDEMIVFEPLTEEDLQQIVSILMSDVIKRLKERELQLEITSEAMQLLVKEGSDFTMGARPLKRAIQRLIEDPISDLILKGDATEGKSIKADVKDNEIVVSV